MKGNRAETSPYSYPPYSRLGIGNISHSRNLGETDLGSSKQEHKWFTSKYFVMFAITFK